MATRPKCKATTAKGKPCKRSALEGTDPPRCVSHVGGKVGRKAELTAEVTDRLAQMLRAGNYVETAAAAAGIGKSTFYDWLERGDPERTDPADQPFREFRARIDAARAEGEARNVALIAKAAASSWQAAAWLLERQHPDRWGRPTSRQPPAGAVPEPQTPADPLDQLDEGVVVDMTERRGRRSG